MTTVQCPCGETFERPSQRGRPAIWCPECRELPVNKRAAREAILDEDGEEVEGEYQVSRFGVHDDLTYSQREAVEAGVAAANQKYAEEIWPQRETLFPDRDAVSAAHEWLHVAIYKVYNSIRPDKWPRGSLIGLSWDIA